MRETCPCVRRGGRPTYPRREGDRCKLFRCPGCKRYRPWCEGAADDQPDLCDRCANKEARRASA